jgi:hypothetical protein
MSQYNNGIRAYTANGALTQYMRVKLTAGSTTTPPQVEAAGAGEQHIGFVQRDAADGAIVSVSLRNNNGTKQAIAAGAITQGATIYGAAAGTVDDTSSGSAIGQAMTAATASGDIIEVVDFSVLSTTAATVSIADSGGFTSTATVEAALAEIYQDIFTVQNYIPIPLMSLKETTNFDVGAIAANGGVLASDTTPILSAINDATDGCQRVTWAASNNDQVTFQVALPPDLDTSADVVIHFRTASGGTTDAVGFTVDSFFNEGDTKVTDTSETNQTTSYAEKIATIANADIPSGAQTLTVGLTPVAHTTDTLNLTAIWIEYKRSIRTS